MLFNIHFQKWSYVTVKENDETIYSKITRGLSHFLFLWIDPFFGLNEEHFTFHLQYKHSGTIANRKYEEQSYPKKSENVRLHSSNSIENAPHYSQSSLENATPSSGTFPLASYKAVPPPPPPGQIVDFSGEMVTY